MPDAALSDLPTLKGTRCRQVATSAPNNTETIVKCCALWSESAEHLA